MTAAWWPRWRPASRAPRPEALPAPPPGHWSRAALALVLVAAALLRAGECRRGLPYLHHWDEPTTASNALQIMQSGDYNPHFFRYGSLMIYLCLIVDVGHYMVLMSRPEGAAAFLTSLGAIETFHASGWQWTISHPTFYLWDRLLVAAMGTATVWLTYRLAARLAGRAAGLLAAGLMSGVEPHVTQSALVLPNAPMAFFVLGCAVTALAFLEEGGPRALMLSLACCGLAASTKYNAVACWVLPAGALLWRRVAPRTERPAAWLWIALLIVPPVVFLAGTPYAFLDLPAFLEGAGQQVREYAVVGHGRATVESGLPHMARQLAHVRGSLGTLPLLIALAGGAAMLAGRAGRAGRLALVFPALYLVAMAGTRVEYHRNVLPVYPFLAAAFGCGGAMLAGPASRAVSRWIPIRTASAAAWVLLGATAAAGALEIAPESYRSWSTAETRSRAVDRLGERLAEAVSPPSAGIAAELRLHPDDLRRLESPVTSAPLVDLICERPDRLGLVLAGARHAVYHQDMASDVEAMDALLPSGAPLDRIEGDPLLLDIFSVNPSLVMFDPAEVRRRVRCGDLLRAPDLRLGANASARGGAIDLLPGGSFETPRILAAPGRHALFVRGRSPAGRRVSRIGLEVLIEGGAAEPGDSPGQRVVVLTSEPSTHAVLFDPPPSGVLAITVRFPRKPALPSLGRADRVTIESLRLVSLPERDG